MSDASRLYLLDTNVLMHDPTALFRLEEHDIYLPMVKHFHSRTYFLFLHLTSQLRRLKLSLRLGRT